MSTKAGQFHYSFQEILEWLIGSHYRPLVEGRFQGRSWRAYRPSCGAISDLLASGLKGEVKRDDTWRVELQRYRGRSASRDSAYTIDEELPGAFADAVKLRDDWRAYLSRKAWLWNNKNGPEARAEQERTGISPRRYDDDIVTEAIRVTLGELFPGRYGTSSALKVGPAGQADEYESGLRCWPFTPVDEHFSLFRSRGSTPSLPFPSREEYLSGSVPAFPADVLVQARLDQHGWAFILDVASVGKTTLALRLATSQNRRSHKAFYLDLATVDPNESLTEVSAAMRRVSQARALLIFDNVHHQPEFARRMWEQWHSRPNGSSLLLVATRMHEAVVTGPAQDLGFFEGYEANPAIGVRPTPEDLVAIAKHFHARLRRPGRPEFNDPPVGVVERWHGDYGTELGAFCIAVLSRLHRFRHGDWELPLEAASEWIRKRWLKRLDAQNLHNLLCLSVCSAQELELRVPDKALPHLGEVDQLLHLGLVARHEWGELGEYRGYGLREPGWGRLVLAAQGDAVDEERVLFDAGARDPVFAAVLSKRLRRQDPGRNQRLLAHLDTDDFARSASEMALGPFLALVRAVEDGGQESLALRLWAVIESDPSRFAEHALETSLAQVASLLDHALERGRDTTPLWEALSGSDKRDAFVALVCNAPLTQISQFIETADRQGRSTGYLWEALESEGNRRRLAECAKETSLDHIGSFLRLAAEQDRDGALLSQAFAERPAWLGASAQQGSMSNLAGFCHHAPDDLVSIALADLTAARWDDHLAEKNMHGARWVAARCGQIGREDLESSIVLAMLRRARTQDFPWQSGGLASVAWMLNHAPDDTDSLVSTFLDEVCTRRWLALQYRYCACGSLAEGLRMLGLRQPPHVVGRFHHFSLRIRIRTELARFSRAPGEERSQAIQLLGSTSISASDLHAVASSTWFRDFQPDDVAALPLETTPHRASSQGVEEWQYQLWLGLRVVAQCTYEPLPVPTSVIAETLARWRFNLAQTSIDTNSREHAIDQGMVLWLERCSRLGVCIVPTDSQQL